jgi:hypothetical protein
MGLSNNPTCRKCGTEEEASVHILCECEALASLRYTYLGSFFWDPEDIRKLSIGAVWNFAKGSGLVSFSTEHGAQRASLKAYVQRARKGSNPNTIQFNSGSLFLHRPATLGSTYVFSTALCPEGDVFKSVCRLKSMRNCQTSMLLQNVGSVGFEIAVV